MANKQLVIALFDGEAAADAAVSALKEWDKASKEIKLGSIGILVKDDEGKIKTQKLGPRHTGTGVVVGAIAGLLTGGLSIIGGAVLGGIAGTFFHKGLGLSKEDLARIDGELDGGKAAVAVLADAEDAEAVSARLAESGGQPETYEVTEEAIEEATAATEAAAATLEEVAPEESEESA